MSQRKLETNKENKIAANTGTNKRNRNTANSGSNCKARTNNKETNKLTTVARLISCEEELEVWEKVNRGGREQTRLTGDALAKN